MDQSERAMLISHANELFNGRDFKNALKIYIVTAHYQGIGRIASVMEHEKKDKVVALKLYKQASMMEQVERLSYDMAQSIRMLVREDHIKLAQEKGENYNQGYKISGQAPALFPSEAINIAKQKLGIKDRAHFSPAEQDGRILKWNPITISRDELYNKKNGK